MTAPRTPKKKRGRPATGKDPLVALRLPPQRRTEIEDWAKDQPDKPNLSEAMRRLIDEALKKRP